MATTKKASVSASTHDQQQPKQQPPPTQIQHEEKEESAGAAIPPDTATPSSSTTPESESPPSHTQAPSPPPPQPATTAEAKPTHTHAQQIQQRPSATLTEFDLGPTLGTGSFGRVRFATHRPRGSVYAIKMLSKTAIIQRQQIQHILDEKAILARLQHPFIVNLHYNFQDPRYLFLVLEYVIGGEFFSHLRRMGHFTPGEARFYAGQVTLVFDYLHKQDIIYRDLKPENLLIDAQGYLKLADFGFAKCVPFPSKTFTFCGTPEYLAPEVLLNKGHGKGVDWWTLGILIYEILVGAPPFNGEDPMVIYQQILQMKPNFPEEVEKDAKSLIKHLLSHDLTKRYGCLIKGAEDIKTHRWFKNMSWEALEARQVPSPFRPEVRGPKDTHNFEQYRESVEEVKEPVFVDGMDPFAEF